MHVTAGMPENSTSAAPDAFTGTVLISVVVGWAVLPTFTSVSLKVTVTEARSDALIEGIIEAAGMLPGKF